MAKINCTVFYTCRNTSEKVTSRSEIFAVPTSPRPHPYYSISCVSSTTSFTSHFSARFPETLTTEFHHTSGNEIYVKDLPGKTLNEKNKLHTFEKIKKNACKGYEKARNDS